MKQLIVCYSYTGNSLRLATARAEQTGADLCELREVRRPGALAAYTVGCVRAMRGKTVPVEPLRADLGAYERITVFAPVWAGQPAPAVNHVFEALPPGREVEVVMVSKSGKSAAEPRLRALVEAKGCRLAGYEDLRASSAH